MKTYYLEDDHFTFELVRDKLAQQGQTRNVKLERIATESDFYSQVLEMAQAAPAWVLLDVMVMWSRPSEVPPSPPVHVQEEGYYEAGLRCAIELRNAGYTGTIVFLSVLEEDWIQEAIQKREIKGPNEVYPKTPDCERLLARLAELTP